MSIPDPLVRITSNSRYVPFDSIKVEDLTPINDFTTLGEALDFIKDRMIITFELTGAEQPEGGWGQTGENFRAIGGGMSMTRDSRWLSWITGWSGGITTANAYQMPSGAMTNWYFRPQAAKAGVTPGTRLFTQGGVPYDGFEGGYGYDTSNYEASMAQWYKWGIRRFHIHAPWGRVAIGSGNQEAMYYQPDSYSCAKHGFTCPFGGTVGNQPMPWLTDDIVDGETAGFVPLFRALTTGSSAGLSPKVWERLTGIGAGDGSNAWFDPNDPIKLTCYNGSINMETFRRWRRWFETSSVLPETEGMPANQYARKRLEESFEPFLRAGVGIGLDALVGAPGPQEGVNGSYNFVIEPNRNDWSGATVPYLVPPRPYLPRNPDGTNAYTHFGAADKGWWSFFSEYVIPNFRNGTTADNIFMEAIASTCRVFSNYLGGVGNPPNSNSAVVGAVANPYVAIGGIAVRTNEEFARAFFGGTASNPPFNPNENRFHYIPEYGDVEFCINSSWSPSPHAGYVDGAGVTHLNGKYWFLAGTAGRGFSDFGPGAAEKPRWQFPSGDAYNSGLEPIISGASFAAGWDYLRIGGEKGYLWGSTDGTRNGAVYSWTQFYGAAWTVFNLLTPFTDNGYTFGNLPIGQRPNVYDPTPIGQQKTKYSVMVDNGMIWQPISYWYSGPFGLTSSYGITHSFNQGFPTIVDFAKYFLDVKEGRDFLDPQKCRYGKANPYTGFIGSSGSLNNIGTVISEAITDKKKKVKQDIDLNRKRTIMYLYPADFDKFANTGLDGTKGAGFYLPTPSQDVIRNRLFAWLDSKMRSWHEKFGFYPDYIAWRMTEFSGIPNNQLSKFEMERGLFYPATVPPAAILDAETPANFSFPRKQVYTLSPIPVGNPVTSLVNAGSDSSYLNQTQFYGTWFESANLIAAMLKTTKEWRNIRKHTAKIGLYRFPFLPENPYGIYSTAQGGNTVNIRKAYWNDTRFPIQILNDFGGLAGFETEEETESMKKRMLVGYRKRYEPVAVECEVVFPEIIDTDPIEDIENSLEIINNIDRMKRTLDLAYDMKTKDYWDTFTGQIQPPSLKDKEIIPTVVPVYGGQNSSGISAGDPLTRQKGVLFNYEKVNFSLIDWVRDEFMRPKSGRLQKIDGIAIQSDYIKRGIESTGISGGSSVNTRIQGNRRFVNKWLSAFGGSGEIIPVADAAWNSTSGTWNPSVDLVPYIKKFFDSGQEFNKRLFNRFEKGVPRVDVIDPYRHSVFAAGWNQGYANIGYPKLIDGLKIDDVVPAIYLGFRRNAEGGSLLRTAGETGNLSSQLFNDLVSRIKLVPKGKRVLLPYYYHQDPISDQEPKNSVYRLTSDGATYSGANYRAHETPGTVKTPTSWAYQQTNDTKSSFASLLRQCAATGEYFDFVADDGESWVLNSPASNVSGWSRGGALFAHGPTGMPAIASFTGGSYHVFEIPSYQYTAENRMIHSMVFDPRWSQNAYANPHTGLTFGGAIERYYKGIAANSAITSDMGYLIAPVSVSNTLGATSGEIMEYFYLEGPNGISAATGPIGCTVLAPPPTANTELRYTVWNNLSQQARNAGNNVLADQYAALALAQIIQSPWRNPFESRVDISKSGKEISRYIAWLAFDMALSDLVMGDLYKKIYLDTLAGSTSEEFRRVNFSHYAICPLGLTESVYSRDQYGHHRFFSGGLSVPWSGVKGSGSAPHLYGEMAILDAKYFPFPRDNYERFSIVAPPDRHTSRGTLWTYNGGEANRPWTDSSAIKFYDDTGSVAGRSYLAMINDYTWVRGMLRHDPNSWIGFQPWVWCPYGLQGSLTSTGYNGEPDAENQPNILYRTDVRYWKELLYHCLLSGAYFFNYFFAPYYPGGHPEAGNPIGGAPGFTAGLTMMQGVINEWNTISGMRRAQPVSNYSGNVNLRVDRILMSDAGGNHPGATGTVISGARLLGEYEGVSAGIPLRETRVWRVTAAPQGVTLYRAEIPGRNIDDLPKIVDLNTKKSYSLLKKSNKNSVGGFHALRREVGGYINPELFSDFIMLQTGKEPIYDDSGTVIVMNPLVGCADSGAEIRHTKTPLPNGFTDEPFLLGSGKEINFSFEGKHATSDATGVPPDGNGIYDPNYWLPNPLPNSKGSVSLVGFYEISPAFGSHGVSGSRFGIEKAVAFYASSGTFWNTLIASKNPATGLYDFDALSTGVSPVDGSSHKLEIKVNGGGTFAQFLIDGSVVRTYTATDSASNILPVGNRAGNGVFAGCLVRDTSLNLAGGEGMTGRQATLLCKSMNLESPFFNKDTQVTVSDRGMWVKRKKYPEMPLYRISEKQPDLPSGYLQTGSGFPSSDPNSIFSQDTFIEGNGKSSLDEVDDLRAIAAWKSDPIGFDLLPSSTNTNQIVTVMAFHPTGIKKVEASLNGGPVATLFGGSGVTYQEFNFIIPKVTEVSPQFSSLPLTPSGGSFGQLNQIRAKVFPFEGRTRILGGAPDETSAYYPGSKKLDVNETSFFIQNSDGFYPISTNESTNFPNEFGYIDTRTAIASRLKRGERSILIVPVNSSPITIPQNGDVGSIATVDPAYESSPIPSSDILENISLVIEGKGNLLVPAINGNPGNDATSYFGVGVSNITQTWDINKNWSMTNPVPSIPYALLSGNIYRLNRSNPLTNYNIGITLGAGNAPSGFQSSNADWIFTSTSTNWGNTLGAARCASFFNIGKIKIKNCIIDRGILPDFFSLPTSKQAIQFEGCTFISSLQPSIDPVSVARNGNVSFINCVAGVGTTLCPANAFGYSRYVVGCTANSIRGNVFSNANVVLNSYATGCNKIDKNNPLFLTRSASNSGVLPDARVKKNGIYSNVLGVGNFADCISMQRNEGSPTPHTINHFDLLYKDLVFSGSTGMADRIEGYVNNVHFSGLSMPNAIVFSPEYRTALLNQKVADKQKMYISRSRFRMIMNEGATFGNALATTGPSYFDGYGLKLGVGVVPQIKPRPTNQIAVGIRGIPWKMDVVRQSNNISPGNTITPLFTDASTTGRVRFGLDMGGGFGPTASGYVQRGLTFASWGRGSFGPVLSPRLCWVYQIQPEWAVTVFDTSNNALGPTFGRIIGNPTDYEIGITGDLARSSGIGSYRIDIGAGGEALFAEYSTFYDKRFAAYSLELKERSQLTSGLIRTFTPSTAPLADSWSFAGASSNLPNEHWLLVGDSGGGWLPTSTHNIHIFGSTANPVNIGKIQIGTNARPLATSAVQRLLAGFNQLDGVSGGGSGGGITITDQYGNLFRLRGLTNGVSSFTGTGATPNTIIEVPGTAVVEVNGANKGNNWISALNILREWNFNGDATDQYAPIDLDINTDFGLYKRFDTTPAAFSFTNPLHDQNITDGLETVSSVAQVTGINGGITLDFSATVATGFGPPGRLVVYRGNVNPPTTEPAGLTLGLRNPGTTSGTVFVSPNQFVQLGLLSTRNTASGVLTITNASDNNTVITTLGLSGGWDVTPTPITLTPNPLIDLTSTADTTANTNTATITGINIPSGIVVQMFATVSVGGSFGAGSFIQLLRNGVVVDQLALSSEGQVIGLQTTYTNNQTIQLRLNSRSTSGSGSVTISNGSDGGASLALVQLRGFTPPV